MSTYDNTITHILADLPERPTAADYRRAAQNLLPYMREHVPPMGEGDSIARLRFLTLVARRDLSLARLIEGHLDATQILREAQRTADSTKLYAIWASGGPSDTTKITGEPMAGELKGSKNFCSGSDIVDHALLHVNASDQLIELDMRSVASRERLKFEEGQWKSAAFSQTHTWTVTFDSLPITRANLVGECKWYFERPGFCLGALAPAACWAGGAMGLVDAVRDRTLKDGHARAHLGAMVAATCSMQSMLSWGAGQVDADPGNTTGNMFPTALLVRHHIERACTEILDRFGRTLGPRPYVFETDNARRIAELTVYIRQCHAERDLEELGGYLENHRQFPSAW
ncbi:hypothetical protein [Marinobacter sp. ATCH36]|uniref:hypothetical protein n=1 Tax=Marinobacter sp. ATCH36 TaxID=2945106 RepID=UPI002021327F|nr:hypothetical protein [Marinobacter sp. ATCH36]MCL7945399.1 hypothetical protein [Marinobacter sp. ATCH36]